MKMTAAYLKETGKQLVIDGEVEVPEPREGQVLVKIAFSGVCHSQLMEVIGARGRDLYLPHMLGHEGSGVVLATGKGVTKVKEGDAVVLTWIKGTGLEGGGSCYRSTSLAINNGIINAGGVTTFMEMAVVSENRCVLIPPGIPFDAAALLGCAIPTGAGIVMNTIKPVPGSSIAIWGLGGIGLSALLATRVFELNHVVAIDVEKHKLEMAKEWGATHVIDASVESVPDRVREITAGKGLDACVEAAGLAKTIEGAFDLVRRGGLCVFASHPRFGDKIAIDPFELICGKRIQGSWGGDCIPDRDIPKFGELFHRGVFPFTKLLSQRFSLHEVNSAFEALRSRKIARALLEIDASLGR